MEEFNPAFLPLYKNMMDSLRLLKQKDVWSFLEGADTYYRTGEVIDMTYTAKILFTSVKFAFDESKKSYFDKVSAGKKSAEAKKKKATTKQEKEEIEEIQQTSTEVVQKSAEVEQKATASFPVEVQENRPDSFSQGSQANLNLEVPENPSATKGMCQSAQYTLVNTGDSLCDSTTNQMSVTENQQTSADFNRGNKEKEKKEEKEKEKEKEKRECAPFGRGTEDEGRETGGFCQQVGHPPSDLEIKKNDLNINDEDDCYLNSKRKTKKEVKKTSYADYVEMEDYKYEKLLENYGQKGTEELISVLNNYKGSSGKKYSDDYFAILKWVVEKVEKEKPHLLQKEVKQDASPVCGWGSWGEEEDKLIADFNDRYI